MDGQMNGRMDGRMAVWCGGSAVSLILRRLPFGYAGGGGVHGGFDRDGWCGGQKLEHDDSTEDESIDVHWLFGLVEQTRK